MQMTTSTTQAIDDLGVDLNVEVSGVRTVAEGVVEITMVSQDGGALPSWLPGAHVELQLANGLKRQYSLCGDPDATGGYTIAVLREPAGRGGSDFIHRHVRTGAPLRISSPRNLFPLETADRYVLIAGGIGITPLLAMVRELDRRKSDWRLFYGGRSRASMAFVDTLAEFGDRVAIHPQDECGLLPLERMIGNPIQDQLVYCCGPASLIDAVSKIGTRWPINPVHCERFGPAASVELDSSAFEIQLHRSGDVLQVPADMSILDVLEGHGIQVPSSCRQGTCGTCEVGIVSGEVDHRDSILTEDERLSNESLFVCCSRAKSPRLVLDV